MWQRFPLLLTVSLAAFGSSTAFFISRGPACDLASTNSLPIVCERGRNAPLLVPSLAPVRRARSGLLGAKAAAVAPIPEDGSIGAVSDVSAWHRGRNKTIRAAHPEIAKLEGSSLSTLLVLGLTNAGLLACTCAAASTKKSGAVAQESAERSHVWEADLRLKQEFPGPFCACRAAG